MPSPRTIIVSNRLPVKLDRRDGALHFRASEGGLATGLNTVYQQGDNVWIGWPGAEVSEEEKETVSTQLTAKNLCPVFLSKEEIEDYYEGFSNETLWPLFHYFPSYASYEPAHYEAYEKVNLRFAEAILGAAKPGDTVWIHDYQLLLLPQMVRERLPEVSIGFFNHIPFPSYEVFRLLPWRKELLRGILGADLIGFHTYDDVRHFLSSVARILSLMLSANEVSVGARKAVVDAFPISIDYAKYHGLADDPATRRTERKLRALMHAGKIVLSIDRLDYSKGIPQRLQAFEIFLSRHPELKGKVTLIQLVVPSRDAVPAYRSLKEEIERKVGEINGRFGLLGWQPVQHFYRSFPERLLSALYKMADVALVTPLRDGMNLVAKEYIASRVDGRGVLVLSEMAGAARELSEALIINPNDVWGVADALHTALTMPEEEQRRRTGAMQALIKKFDVHHWVRHFTEKLGEVRAWQQETSARALSADARGALAAAYERAERRLIFLDYDGTLVPFQKRPELALPDEEVLALLPRLTADPRNRVVITSGRDWQTLSAWLGHLPLDFIAEHGAWQRLHGAAWEARTDLSADWKTEIRPVMDLYASRTPGALVEEKSYSLAWHYRRVHADLGALRAGELAADVRHFVLDRGLHILQGDKVVEVKSNTVNKGKAAHRWLAEETADFILAIGDDHTDEDTFKAMPKDAWTIKVGSNISAARHFVEGHADVRMLLQELAAHRVPGPAGG